MKVMNEIVKIAIFITCIMVTVIKVKEGDAFDAACFGFSAGCWLCTLIYDITTWLMEKDV